MVKKVTKRNKVILPKDTGVNAFSFIDGYEKFDPIVCKFQHKKHWYYIKGTDLPLIPDDDKFHYCPNVTTIANKLDKSYVLLPWAKKLVSKTYTKNLWKIIQALTKEDINLPTNAKAPVCKAVLQTVANTINKIETLAFDEPENIRLSAVDIGLEFHKWYENYVLYCMGINKTMPVWEGKKPLLKACDRIKRFIDTNVSKFLGAEDKIYSRKYNFVGTKDNSYISKHDGCKVLGDLKTTSGVYASTRMQLAAYVIGDEEMTGEEASRRVVTLVDKHSGDISFINLENRFKTDIRQDFIAFLGLRAAYMWEKNA